MEDAEKIAIVHVKSIFVEEDKTGNIVGFANGGGSRNDEFEHLGELYDRGTGVDIQKKADCSNDFISLVFFLLYNKPSTYEALGPFLQILG
ncbi:hypothetical protein [Paenibacillus elgii]|uniref:hypothetical protein n=1 Tax=Paenibacillus elgii TaxID=189691 RepID=UPI00203D96D3|nr:hypothetical protein [Paenibacillus elgii]MCM3272741.1 hypothetical protein [Paenibacillus elgii]